MIILFLSRDQMEITVEMALGCWFWPWGAASLGLMVLGSFFPLVQSLKNDWPLSPVDRRSAQSNKHCIFCFHHLLLLPGSGKAFKQPIFVISHQERMVSCFSPRVATAWILHRESTGTKPPLMAAAFKCHPSSVENGECESLIRQLT